MNSDRLILRCAAIIGAMLFAPYAKAQSLTVSEVMTNAVSARDSVDLPPADGSLWRFEGPSGIRSGLHTGLGLDPFSGRINEVAIDPRNPMIMYATAATGGVWKTVDAGQNWAPRSAGFLIQSTTAVAIDPNNSSHVFVGTGDYKRATDTEPFSVGVMRSLDGGLSWDKSGQSQMQDFTVSRIVVDPRKGQQAVYAATGRGGRLPGGRVFRSIDGAEPWSDVGLPDANWDDLELCSDGFLWAAATQKKNVASDAGGDRGLLFKSSDGRIWFPVPIVTPGFNLVNTMPVKLHIACGQTSLGNVVFVAVAKDASARVFGTTDGATWTEVGTVNAGNGQFVRGAFGVTLNFLFFGSVNLMAAPLSNALGPLVFTNVADPLPTDIQCIVPDAVEKNAIFVCDDKGLYRRSLSTGLVSLNATLGITQIWGMDVHPGNGNLVAIGEQDFGDSVSFYGQGRDAASINTPTWGVVSADDGTNAVFKGDQSSDVFTSNREQVRAYRGEAGPPLLPVENTATPPFFAPDNNAPLLYRSDLDLLSVPGSTRLAKFTHLAFTQADASAVPANGQPFGLAAADRVISLAACPTNKNILYAGSETGQILRSINGGETWSPLGTTATDGSNTPPVWAISPSAANCSDVLVGVGYEDALSALNGTVPRTVVLGTNHFDDGDRLFHKLNVTLAGPWIGVHGAGALLPRAPVFSIARDPAAPGTDWFVATDVGVFRTHNGGNTWRNATGPLGLPNVPARSLRLSADGNTIYVGTFGRSIWSMDVNPPNNFFGLRGIVTQASRPLAHLTVTASGPGRIKRWLKNTLTTGVAPVTAAIEIGETATISAAHATIVVTSADLVSLVAPDGTPFPMTLSSGQFELFAPSSLIGRGMKGSWTFQIRGKFDPVLGLLTPQVQSANIDFQFTGVSTFTDSNGEYTFDYLAAGTHNITVPSLALSRAVGLSNHQTGVDFALAPVGVAALTPNRALVHVKDSLTYNLAYTITDNRSWQALDKVQLTFRDGRETVLALEFDPSNRSVREVRSNGSHGPAFEPGRPNRLENDAAVVYLSGSQFVTGLPDPSSFTVDLSLSFKPKADKRIFNVELSATEKAGNRQGPYLVGVVQVGDIPVPVLPPVDPDEGPQDR